jgi:hypothetical protein
VFTVVVLILVAEVVLVRLKKPLCLSVNSINAARMKSKPSKMITREATRPFELEAGAGVVLLWYGLEAGA